MEVRQIDISEIKNPKRAELLNLHIIHHAGHRGDWNFIGLKTSKSPDRSLIHPCPAPSSFSFLIKRALTNHHAGTAGVVLEPPTQDKPLFPPQILPGRPAPYHLNAGRIGTGSKNSTLLERQSAPDSPAPSYCIHNGTLIQVDRAGKADRQPEYVGSERIGRNGADNRQAQARADPAPDSQTSNHHNAGATEMGCTRLFPPPREQISPILTRSPAPSENARAQDLRRSPEVPDPGVPFTLKSVLNGLLDRLLQHSAYKNPRLIRTNYGWQRREDFEKDQH